MTTSKISELFTTPKVDHHSQRSKYPKMLHDFSNSKPTERYKSLHFSMLKRLYIKK